MRNNMRVLMLGAAVVVAGCSAKDEPNATADDSAAAPSASSTGTAQANEVTITATDYAFDAPAQIPAGLTTFTMIDSGKEVHHAMLIKLDQGKSFDDLMAGFKMMKPGTRPPGWIIFAGGPGAAAPGASSSLTTVLEPGNYALVCFVPDSKGVPHVMHGMARALTVTPAENANMTEPVADISVSLVDYKFNFSKPLTAGKHTLKIETGPGQPHEFVLFQLMPGKTAADFPKFFESRMQGQPPGVPIGGVSGVAAGRASFYTVDLKPGEYAIVCFLEDAKDGKPHFLHGMIQQIRIT